MVKHLLAANGLNNTIKGICYSMDLSRHTENGTSFGWDGQKVPMSILEQKRAYALEEVFITLVSLFTLAAMVIKTLITP